MKKSLTGIVMLATLLSLLFAVYSTLVSFSSKETTNSQPTEETARPMPAASHEPHILFLPE